MYGCIEQPGIDPDTIPHSGVVKASFIGDKHPAGVYLIRPLNSHSRRRLLSRWIEGKGAITGESGLWVSAEDFATCEALSHHKTWLP